MAKLQWLGTQPRETKWSHLAQALKGGVEGYIGGRERMREREEKATETGLKRRELDISEKKAESYQSYVDLQREEQEIQKVEGRRKMFTTILEKMKDIPPDKQAQAWDVMGQVLSAKGEMVGDAINKMKGIIISDSTLKSVEEIESEAQAKEKGKQAGYKEVWGEDDWMTKVADIIAAFRGGPRRTNQPSRYTVTPAE